MKVLNVFIIITTIIVTRAETFLRSLRHSDMFSSKFSCVYDTDWQPNVPLKAELCLSSRGLIDRRALPHVPFSVVTAYSSLSCHEATRWLGMRVTCDWHCSRVFVRVTPREQRVGGWHQGKPTCGQCNYSKLITSRTFQYMHECLFATWNGEWEKEWVT